MSNFFTDEDIAQQMKLSSLLDEFREYERLTFNVTTLEEWRNKWLVGFYNYMYQIKDTDGNLIDPDGEVIAFWNGRRTANGSNPNLFLDTHIRDASGTTVYIIPSTVTSIGTKITDVAVEPALFTLISNALSNPFPAYRELEVNQAIIAKFNGRKEDYTEAYKKMLIINHMFITEGYPPLIESAVTKAEDTAVKATPVGTGFGEIDTTDNFTF